MKFAAVPAGANPVWNVTSNVRERAVKIANLKQDTRRILGNVTNAVWDPEARRIAERPTANVLEMGIF